MAISITKQAGILSPVYNPMDLEIIESSEANRNDASFEYSFEIKVNDVLVTTLHQKPGFNGTGIVDLGQILRNYTDYSFKANETLSEYRQNLVIKYQVICTNIGGISQSQADTGIKYAFAGGFQEWETFNHNDYMLKNSTSKFLTKWKGNRIVDLDDNAQLTTIIGDYDGSVSTYTGIKVIVYRKDGTNYTVNIPYTSSGNTAISIGVGPKDLNSLPTMNIDNTTKYYTVQERNLKSEVVRFDMVDESKTKRRFNLLWVNSLGGVDGLNFSKGNTVTITTKRSYFEQNGIKSLLNSVPTKSIKIKTDYLSEYQSESLEDLFSSPEVRIKINGKLVSANLKTTSAKIFTKNNEKLISYNIDVEISKTLTSQMY